MYYAIVAALMLVLPGASIALEAGRSHAGIDGDLICAGVLLLGCFASAAAR